MWMQWKMQRYPSLRSSSKMQWISLTSKLQRNCALGSLSKMLQLRRDRLCYNYALLDYSGTAVDTIKEMAEKMTNRTPSTRPRPTEPPGLANGKTGIASSIKPLCISNRIGTHPLRRP